MSATETLTPVSEAKTPHAATPEAQANTPVTFQRYYEEAGPDY